MSNKSFYSFIAFGVIGLFVAGFFIVNALTPGIAPNPGHLISQVAPPAGCGSGQVLGWSGSSWGCVDMSSGGVSTWNEISGIPSDISDGDSDDQTLSVSGQTLSLTDGGSVTLPSGVSYTYYCFTSPSGGTPVCTNAGGTQGYCPSGYTQKLALGSWGTCSNGGAYGTWFLPPGSTCGYESGYGKGIAVGNAYVCSQ